MAETIIFDFFYHCSEWCCYCWCRKFSLRTKTATGPFKILKVSLNFHIVLYCSITLPHTCSNLTINCIHVWKKAGINVVLSAFSPGYLRYSLPIYKILVLLSNNLDFAVSFDEKVWYSFTNLWNIMTVMVSPYYHLPLLTLSFRRALLQPRPW